MTDYRLIVGYKNSDEEQRNAFERVLEELDVEPIDQLLVVVDLEGNPIYPPEYVDYYSLMDLLDEIVKQTKKNKADIKDLEKRVKDLEQA